MDAWEMAMNANFGGGGFQQPQPWGMNQSQLAANASTYQPQTLIANPYTTGPHPASQGLQVAPTGPSGTWQSAPNYIPQMTNFMSVYRPGGTAGGAVSGGPSYGEPEGMGRETQIDMGFSNPTQRYGMPAGTNPSPNPYGLLGPGPSAPSNPYGTISRPPPSPAYGSLTPPPSPYGSLAGVPRNMNTGAQQPTTGVRMPAGSPYGNLSGVPANPYGLLTRPGDLPAQGAQPTSSQQPSRYAQPAQGVQMPGQAYGGFNPDALSDSIDDANGYQWNWSSDGQDGRLPPQQDSPYGDVMGGEISYTSPVMQIGPRDFGQNIISRPPPSRTYGTLPMRTNVVNPTNRGSGTNYTGGYAPSGTGGSMPAPAPPRSTPMPTPAPPRSTPMPPPANYGALPRTITNQTTSPYVGQTSKFTNSVPQTGGYQSYGAPAAMSQSQAYTSRYGSASPPGLLTGGAALK